MGKRSRFWILSCILFVGLLASPAASPGEQTELEALMSQYATGISKGSKAMEGYDYEQAMASLTPAIKSYHKILSVQAKGCHCGAEEAYDIRMLVQSPLMRYIMLLGQKLFDQNRFEEALKVYDQGQMINPDYPCLRYEKGFTYFTMEQYEKASVELYEAKRLARFPARRNVVDSHKFANGVYCNRSEVDERSDGLLEEMEFKTDYPIEKDLSNGEMVPDRIVPGMGINMRWKNKVENIYFDSLAISINHGLGSPDDLFSDLSSDGKKLLRIRYGKTLLTFDKERSQLQSIQLSESNHPILTPAGYLSANSSTEEILEALKQDYGFKREQIVTPKSTVKEALHYTHLGLIFFISQQDKIITVLLYNPEEGALSPSPFFANL